MVRFFLLVIGELWLLVGGISGWRRRVLGSRGGRGRNTDCRAQLGDWVQDNGGEAGSGSVERGGEERGGVSKIAQRGVYFYSYGFFSGRRIENNWVCKGNDVGNSPVGVAWCLL